ncbi:MAG: tRNA (N6-isopentenyl adenosine(37)-C2)-methylthiotransferase MiaB [Treponema sp.]|nr:tRNA (N6-isopentenyl adenosine(37)-C2)-methylthiotransferase MiaB [Treponema sp.]
MTYFFETYGCEMNIAESASIEQILISRGWKKALSAQLCDMVIINTCSVRATAETRIFGRLGFYAGLKKVRNAAPDAKTRSMEEAAAYVEKNGPVPLTLVVMGCMAERLLKSLQKDFPVVDYVVGTYAKNKFGDIISAVEEGKSPVPIEEDPVYTFAPVSYEEGAFSTFVPIMHGCNNFCTYCIVPYVRGREVSRPVDEILAELDVLSSRGVKEITLLGQNVNSYRGAFSASGTANANGAAVSTSGDASANTTITFPQLLKNICSHIEKTKSPIRWIRFESSNPKDFSDELIETIAQTAKRAEENPGSPTICRGLHIAVQHGSSRILKLMNRRYTREAYMELVKKIREKIPGIQLSTDIMLGFPGETEEDFDEAYSLMKEVRYESAFMYYFNPREGTPAAKMDDQIDLETKKERLQKIIDLQLKITTDVMQERVGKTITVLADIISRDDKNELLGKTEENERVAFKGSPSLIGHFVKVHLDSLNGNTFRGTLIE